MKDLKKVCFSSIFFLLVILLGSSTLNAQNKKDSTQTTEKSDRNVMLNAASNNKPREVNVGIPATRSTVLENDLPVTFNIDPEFQEYRWRQSVSLKSVGLLDLHATGISTHVINYAVNSYSKFGDDHRALDASFSTSHFGWLKADVNTSGPLGKGFYYTAGMYLNYDPESYKLKFSNYSDKTRIFRAGLTHRFANGKGELNVLYKFSQSAVLYNAAVFEYQKGGKAKEVDYFRIGRDSYLPVEDAISFLDVFSGKTYTTKIGNFSDDHSTVHSVDFLGNYKINDNLQFRFSTRYYNAKENWIFIAPSSIQSVTAADGFHYADGTAYEGHMQTSLAEQGAHVPINVLMGRAELSYRLGSHHFRTGLFDYFYHEGNFAHNRALFYQEVAANPHKLLNSNTDSYGVFAYNTGSPVHKGNENKLNLFLIDQWNATPWLDIDYSLDLRYHRIDGYSNTDSRTAGFTMVGKQWTPIKEDWLNPGAGLKGTIKLTRSFGFELNGIYTTSNGALGNYSSSVRPVVKSSHSRFASAGIYYNAPFINIVSQFTYISVDNNKGFLTLVNPDNSADINSLTAIYKIKTAGWTTDMILTPFRGFNLHALLTLQSPQYDDFTFSAYGREMNYNKKTVQGISKTLIELDPSYTTHNGKFRLWASARYFSKQYANYTNVLYFKGWWETFAGVSYKLNQQVGLDINVVNPLNQRGAKGTINGAEMITDPTPYYGRLMTTGSYIRPFTVEATVTIHI